MEEPEERGKYVPLSMFSCIFKCLILLKDTKAVEEMLKTCILGSWLQQKQTQSIIYFKPISLLISFLVARMVIFDIS